MILLISKQAPSRDTVISMLLAGRAENVPLTKIGGMLEVNR